MIRRLIILLLIVSYLFADVQLVNDYRVIIVKDGQKFSINDDSKKYTFESIDFDLGLINKTVDIKYIKKINLYAGNSSKEFATVMFLFDASIPVTFAPSRHIGSLIKPPPHPISRIFKEDNGLSFSWFNLK